MLTEKSEGAKSLARYEMRSSDARHRDNHSDFMNESDSDDYKETRTLCYCCAFKIGIIVIVSILWLDVMIRAIILGFVFDNETMDLYYAIIYTVIAVALLVAAVTGSIWLFGDDTPETRKTIPTALIIACIASLLIGIWVVIYFEGFYPF